MSVVTKEHCFVCFEALENKLNGKNYHKARDAIAEREKDKKYPLFCTWFKNGNLRGCIGCFSPLPMPDGLIQYAKIAAFEDTRFSPMKSSEIKSLKNEVSLLHSFEDCKDLNDWEIGKHGTIFKYNGRSSTFLPEVAEEQGWTKEETIKELAYKAGFRKPLSEAELKNVKLQRYQSAHIEAEYSEFLDYEKASI